MTTEQQAEALWLLRACAAYLKSLRVDVPDEFWNPGLDGMVSQFCRETEELPLDEDAGQRMVDRLRAQMQRDFDAAWDRRNAA